MSDASHEVPESGQAQDVTGRRHLRLDYGHNPRTNTIDYHWNQQRVYAQFRISDHTPAGRSGARAYQAAKYFKYAGRLLLVAGAAIDVVSIARASKPLRRASEVMVAWAGAWVGCKLAGPGGAAVGTAVAPGVGTAIGGVTACIIGGAAGYVAGSSLGGGVYDWAEGTTFLQVPEVAPP